MKISKIILFGIAVSYLSISTYIPNLKIKNIDVKNVAKTSNIIHADNKNIFDYMPEINKNNESRNVTFSDLKPYGEPIDYFEYIAKVKGVGTTSESGKSWCLNTPYDVGDPSVDYFNNLPFEFGTEKSNKIYKIPKATNNIIVLRLLNFPLIEDDYCYGYIEDYNKNSQDQDSFFGMINNTNQELEVVEDDSIDGAYQFFDQLPYVYSPASSNYDKINPFIINFNGKIDFDFVMSSTCLDVDLSDFINSIDELGSFKIQPYIVEGYTYENIMQDGDQKDIYVNIDDNLSQDQILTQVKAQDVLGKGIQFSIESSSYIPNKIGAYNIVLKAEDNYGLVSKITLVVHVVDITAPKIVQKSNIRIAYGQKISEKELLEYFTITDNVKVYFNKFILPDGFAFDTVLKYGKYSLSIVSTDSSSNATRFDFNIDVYDGTAPVFSRIGGQISDPITIGYSKTLNYDINNIISLFEANDAIDGKCDIYLKSGKINMTLGSQTLVLAAKDKMNNESSISIIVTIVNDIPPIFILSDKIIQTTPSNPLSLEQIQQVIERYAIKNEIAKDIKIDATNYLNNSNIEGEYNVSFSYLDQNNQMIKDSINIVVKNEIIMGSLNYHY